MVFGKTCMELVGRNLTVLTSTLHRFSSCGFVHQTLMNSICEYLIFSCYRKLQICTKINKDSEMSPRVPITQYHQLTSGHHFIYTPIHSSWIIPSGLIPYTPMSSELHYLETNPRHIHKYFSRFLDSEVFLSDKFLIHALLTFSKQSFKKDIPLFSCFMKQNNAFLLDIQLVFIFSHVEQIN